MKLAYLANIRFPSDRAHAAQIAHMCHAFESVGQEVTLFVNRSGSEIKASPFTYFGLKNNVLIEHIASTSLFKPLRFSFYLREFTFACNFLRTVNIKKFDVLYCRNKWVVLILLIFIRSEKLVWESHEAKFNPPARIIRKLGIKVVVISKGIYDEYISKKFDKKNLLIADDGIDESFFLEVREKKEIRKQLDLPEKEKIVMYIGGLDTWKGIETFCEAAAKQSSKDILFVVIGGKKEQVSNLAKKYSKVRFLGMKPYRDLRDNQQAADILVVPNTAKNDVSSLYTSPLKLFAHMASNIPLAISNIPSLTSVVDTNYVYIFKPDDADSLSNAVQTIFADYEQALVNARKTRELAREYTWNNRAKNIELFLLQTS